MGRCRMLLSESSLKWKCGIPDLSLPNHYLSTIQNSRSLFPLEKMGKVIEKTSCYLIEIQASSNLLYSNSQAIPLSGDCEIVIDWIGWDTDGPIKHVYSFGLFGEWYCCWLAIRPLGLLIQGFSQFRVDQSHSEGLKHRLLGPAPQSYWFNRLMVGP